MNTELRILSSRSPGREQSMAMARHAALATNLDNLSLMPGSHTGGRREPPPNCPLTSAL